MAFTISLCPYCGGEISADEAGCVVCNECGKRTYRSRSNRLAFLSGKPYEDEFANIINSAPSNPDNALAALIEKFTEVDEPDADLYFTRGYVYSLMGEDGKAHNDWKKGIEVLKDVRYIDAYITLMCNSITKLIVDKEREFIEFDAVRYIDDMSNDVHTVTEISCKGIFYVTVYRNIKMLVQAGELAVDDDIYVDIIPKLLRAMVPYVRNCKTIANIIGECLEDFGYDPETYEDDDCLEQHMYALLKDAINEKTKDFSDEHLVRIFRHWTDDNMGELASQFGSLVRSVRDDSFLQNLIVFSKADRDDFNLEDAIDEFAERMLLLDEESEDPEML